MKEMITKPHSLGESVDIIRKDVTGLAEDIKELYELDEDNYQMIKALKAELKKATDRLDRLTRAAQNQKVKSFFRFVLIGGAALTIIAWIKEYCDELKKRIDLLELENECHIDNEEESDG